MTNEGHPWKHGWGHSAPSNYDSTAFALLSVNKSDPSKRKVLQEHIPSNHTTRVDLRLLRKPSGSINSNKSKVYNVTYNSYGLLNPKTFDNNYRNMKSNVNPQCFYYKDKQGKVHETTPQSVDSNDRIPKAHKTILKNKYRWCTFQMRATMKLKPQTNNKIVPVFRTYVWCAPANTPDTKEHPRFCGQVGKDFLSVLRQSVGVLRLDVQKNHTQRDSVFENRRLL